MEFQGGVTATFTMTAFTQEGGRRIRIHGTKGDLVASEARNHIEVRTYCPHQTYSITPAAESGGHGGGDDRTLRAFMLAAQAGDPQAISTSAQASLESHMIVFAAEKARLEKRVVEMSEL